MNNMYHLKKLNARGISHLIALMGVIVVSGVIGSYLLVASHADSCTGTSAPTSSPTSTPVCPPVSSPASSPTTSVTCTVKGVVSPVSSDASFTPSVTFRNKLTTGSVTAQFYYDYAHRGTPVRAGSSLSVPTIAANKTQTVTLPTFQTRGLTAGTYSLRISGNSSIGTFGCAKSFSVVTK